MNNISQEKLQILLRPTLAQSGINYKKFQSIYARIAKENEKITTFIDGKKETTNTAQKGDYIVKNLSKSKEQYIVPQAKFYKRYLFEKKIDAKWNQYLPQGQVKAIEVNQQLLTQLGQQTPFYINAPWGEQQRVEKADKLVSPLPQQDEIYRIAASAFKATYTPIKTKFQFKS